MDAPADRNAAHPSPHGTATHRRGGAGVVPALALAVLALFAATPLFAASNDSCVDCHSDASFLVKNKKLYDYYQGWTLSTHSQEGVTCDDCHGGNPRAGSKKAAHGGQAMVAKSPASPINYRNIPKTCARCHEDVYRGFRSSQHYKHFTGEESPEQAPTCVTCHGSVNSSILNVRSVGRTCSQCHNEKTGNHPEIPGRAETILNRFLSIHRFYRFITVRGEPNQVQSFFRLVDPMLDRLGQEWHRFDLERIETQTQDLLQLLKTERNEIKSRGRKG